MSGCLPASQRIGVWFGQGLHNAMAARAAWGQLQAEYPGADWVLFGPQASLFLFEMDARVPVYIPLRALEPRRPAQTRLSYYLEKRAQFKKLRGLKLDLCIGVSALAALPEQNQQADAQFQHVQKMLGVGGQFMQQELPSFYALNGPCCRPGPKPWPMQPSFIAKPHPACLRLWPCCMPRKIRPPVLICNGRPCNAALRSLAATRI